MTAAFPPTPEAARERLARIDLAAYARTRNALDGAVSRLSPYVTHGFLGLRDVLEGLPAPVPPGHKFVSELGWRAYFRHVWAHEGEGVFESLHEGPLPQAAYARELPADIRTARTGVPAVDAAVRELYATGWLHNHARLWLASYVVHLRRVHWRTGADWLYGHLLDGDLASNHLSWQWVAGTASAKPYLFNADNVALFGGADSRGSGIDAPYAALEAIARGGAPLAGGWRAGEGVAEPPLRAQAPADAVAGWRDATAADVDDRDLWLVHPWSLADPPPGTLPVLLWQPAFHRRWPWSERRWRFVCERMTALTRLVWPGPVGAPRSVRGIADPHLDLRSLPPLAAPRPLFTEPPRRCRSFSAWWRAVALAPPTAPAG